MADRGTHCRFGHPYSRRKCGKQVCLICASERVKRRRRDNPEVRLEMNARMRRWRDRDRPAYLAKLRAFRAGKTKLMHELKSAHGCLKCGETHPACLEFHHRDPTQKEVNLSQVAWRWTLDRLLEEIAKCDVLCSNCHRKLHWGHLVQETT